MALYDDASFIFLASGAARTDTKDFSKIQCVKPVEAVSSTDLVINGDFSIDGPGTDGALGTAFGSYGWNTIATDESANEQEGTTTIKNGVLKLTNAAGDVDCRAYVTDGSGSRAVLTTNSYYKLVYTIVENDGCTDFKIYNGAGAVEDAPSSVGTHTRVVRNTSNQLFLFFNKTESSSISIDNVSLKEFTTRNADFDISRDANLDATRVGPTGLIEKGRENLAHYSNNFATTIGGGGWGHSGINTISTGQDGYDGTTNATAVYASTSTAKHQVTLGTSQSLPGTDFSLSGVFTLSVHAKPNGYDHLIIRSDRTNVDASFNIATGVLGTKGSECIESSMTAVGNGFYRCQATFAPGAATTFLSIGMMEQDDTTDFTGNTSKGYILQDAQLEVGLVATDLIPTSGAAGTAGIKEDEPRFDYPLAGGAPSLLIEPQRQNLIINSEYFGGSTWNASNVTVVNNDAVSPEGVKNAAKLVINNGESSGAEIRLASNLSVTNAKLYTFSVFAKAAGFDGIQLDVTDDRFGNANVTADLTNGTITAGGGTTASSIENYGNGWYRIILVCTCSSTGTTAVIFRLHTGGINGTGDGSKGIHVYGAQFEEGANATYYIPTHGADATRSAYTLPEIDLNANGITIGTVATVLLEASKFNADSQTSFLQLRTGTDSNNRLLFFSNTSAIGSTHDINIQHRQSGVSKAIQKTGLTRGDIFKCIARVDGTTFNMFVNGVKLGTTQTVVAADLYDKISLIRNGNVTDQSGHKNKSVVVWASALTDQQCIDLTKL